MPRLDGTGPQGLGSRTGRALGCCPFGYGYGYGGRRGGRMPFAPYCRMSEKQEKEMLEDELEVLRDELKEAESRLGELKQGK